MSKRIFLCLILVLTFSYYAQGEDVSNAQKKELIEEVAEEIKAVVVEEAAEVEAAEIAEDVKESYTVQKGLQITRPDRDSGPTKVGVLLYVLDIDNVDTARQTFEANIYYEFTWSDPRLAGQYEEKVRKPMSDIWHPHIQFINQQRLWTTFPKIVDIYPSGKVLYKQRAWGSFSQPLKLSDFPFDKQSFNIQLTAAGYKNDEVELYRPKMDSSGIAPSFSVPDWKILGWDLGPEPSPIAKNKDQYVMSIKAVREHGYYIIQIIIPLFFIILMSWAVFWIDPEESGTQIMVAVTAMLTLIAFRFMAGVTLPKIDYLTRLDLFILASTSMVFLALVEVIISSLLSRKNRLEEARRLDRFSRWLFPLALVIISVKILFVNILF